MDPVTAALVPSAQSLVTAILTDGWAHVRGALARRWSRQTGEAAGEIEGRLDAAHVQAEGLGEERAVQCAYWAGYLAGVVGQRPDLLDAVRDLPRAPDVHNTNSGTVTTLVQARDIGGDITFGAP